MRPGNHLSPRPIQLTEFQQLAKIHTRENNPNLMLRVTVESGGCHGYQYLMSLTESFDPEEDAYVPQNFFRVDVECLRERGQKLWWIPFH
jgi:Fe-S cluster assembly iron-binding protein IscA